MKYPKIIDYADELWYRAMSRYYRTYNRWYTILRRWRLNIFGVKLTKAEARAIMHMGSWNNRYVLWHKWGIGEEPQSTNCEDFDAYLTGISKLKRIEGTHNDNSDSFL